MSEVPLDLLEVTTETERILTSLARPPLTVRQSEISTTDLPTNNQPVISEQQQQQQQQHDPSDNKTLVSFIYYYAW